MYDKLALLSQRKHWMGTELWKQLQYFIYNRSHLYIRPDRADCVCVQFLFRPANNCCQQPWCGEIKQLTVQLSFWRTHLPPVCTCVYIQRMYACVCSRWLVQLTREKQHHVTACLCLTSRSRVCVSCLGSCEGFVLWSLFPLVRKWETDGQTDGQKASGLLPAVDIRPKEP